MHREITSRAVVIGRYSAGEGSVRVLLYTEELGMVTAIAKSAREERSKLRPHLQGGTTGTFSLVRGAYDWRVIGAVDTQNKYFSFVKNAPAQRASANVIHLVSQLVRGEGSDPGFFDALWDLLHSLNALDENEVRIAERLAVLRILFALGYVAPESGATYVTSSDYSKEILKEVAPKERDLIASINEGLLVSGLA
ncbi:hypothetical protein COU15_02940 [Candidatus Kaiserbacteria bacterium CG10_big_fil_rev_8_21_14_0_10_45_20]|uniref:DNA replication/recombination mediator RecO N-terminal domain-containing protein n=1 Tax=Candidatus Kaiserbacteria bacterium CG10_big_fil_rev_8_21_14_0_10_45_20 TaxID=1974607 RepID=A0A2H0UF80_9BACT|nr:MAG: hypothetical protein COU15_02940 [Candidatus Kaiserbacteria bacterium CG10_big_fil_rev_8_21_14_0_10_45_20]